MAEITHYFYEPRKIVTYMHQLDLTRMSRFVFDLPSEYRNILKFMAENGPSNLNSISNFTKKSELTSVDRWAVKKRLEGSNRITGLIPTDYVFEKLEEKHRYKKQERTYYLQSKGIIASIASTSLSKNYFFNKIVEMANKNTKGEKYPQFIKEYLVSQIRLFLAVHYLEGIQLTWQTNTTMYYYDYFHNLNFGVNLTIKNEQLYKEFSKIVEDFVILQSTYDYLNGKPNPGEGIFPSIFYYDKPEPKFRIDKKNWHSYVYHWYIGIWNNLIEEPENDVRRISKPKGLDYSDGSISWGKFAPQVKEKLRKLGIRDFYIKNKNNFT